MRPTEPPRAAGSVTDPRRDSDAAAPRRSAGDVAFPRDARLLSARAYDAVFADNRRLADRHWTVLAHRAPGEPARLGLAVAKRRARRAVDRNRIKRVARESFRHARDALAGHHVVVMNRDAAASAGAAELRRALDALWGRLLRQSGRTGGSRRR